VRLTRPEMDRWTRITGFAPVDVRTTADLVQYVSRCKRHFWGTSEDTRFLHFLIDEELDRNLASLPSASALDGGRGELERELLWLVALGGNQRRIDELTRVLGVAANHALTLVEPPHAP